MFNQFSSNFILFDAIKSPANYMYTKINARFRVNKDIEAVMKKNKNIELMCLCVAILVCDVF